MPRREEPRALERLVAAAAAAACAALVVVALALLLLELAAAVKRRVPPVVLGFSCSLALAMVWSMRLVALWALPLSLLVFRCQAVSLKVLLLL